MGQEALVRVMGGIVGTVILIPMTVLWGRWLLQRARRRGRP